MAKDKYSALWISHTSLADFLKCPRSYYLRNVYKDPKSKRKIQIVAPALSLGMAVHEVLDQIASLPTPVRFNEDLLERYDKVWSQYSGKVGGFTDEDTEYRYKERGADMLRRVQNHPGPLKNKAVKISQELPYYFLSEEDNIILCGKVDWLEYLPETDSVHIIDFKTSKSEEDPNSMQLPIYTLLVSNTQQRKATKASYWYLGLSDDLQEKSLPDLQESHELVLKHAKQVLLAKKLNKLECPKGGCMFCAPLEKVLAGQGEFVGVDEKMRKDNYLLQEAENNESVIL